MMKKLIKWFFKILGIKPRKEEISLKESDHIELSVVIPMFKAKYIGWLPLEGLIRQKNINFKWELVIAEELGGDAFGENNIRAYEDRLKAVGCVKIVYKSLNKWIPLSNKWVLLANMCDENSRILVLHAADNYSAPLRLARHHEVFTNNKVHMHIPVKAIYYDILTRKTILHAAYPSKDCAARAMLTYVVKNLPKEANVKRGVDGWLLETARNFINGEDVFKIFYDKENNDWQYGLNTYGFNNIMDRYKDFKVIKGRFKKCPIDVNNTIPKEVLDRLYECRKLVEKYKRGMPK